MLPDDSEDLSMVIGLRALSKSVCLPGGDSENFVHHGQGALVFISNSCPYAIA